MVNILIDKVDFKFILIRRSACFKSAILVNHKILWIISNSTI